MGPEETAESTVGLADLEMTRGLAIQLTAVGTLGRVAWGLFSALYELGTGQVGLLAARSASPSTGFLERGLAKFTVRNQEFQTDDSGDVELTDWESVVSFAGEFALFVEERLNETVEAG